MGGFGGLLLSSLGSASNTFANYLGQQSASQQSYQNAGDIGSLMLGQTQQNQQQETGDYYNLGQAGLGAAGNITNYGGMAGNALTGGYANANNTLAAGYGTAANALTGGTSTAQGMIRGGYGSASSTLNPLTSVASMAGNVATPLGAGYQESPGYQFQLQQGEQALAAQQSAAGGRDSGAAEKALLGFSQGLANQDYQQYVGNELTQHGQELSAAGLGYGAANTLANLGYNAGTTGAGIAANSGNALANLFAGGANTAAGYNAASGAGLASIYGGMGNSLASIGMNTAQNQANLGLNYNQLNTNAWESTFPSIGARTYSPSGFQMWLGSTAAGMGGAGGGLTGLAAGGGG